MQFCLWNAPGSPGHRLFSREIQRVGLLIAVAGRLPLGPILLGVRRERRKMCISLAVLAHTCSFPAVLTTERTKHLSFDEVLCESELCIVCLQLFEPGGNPLIFVADALGMKRKNPLCMGVGRNDLCVVLLLFCHLLQALQIFQTAL